MKISKKSILLIFTLVALSFTSCEVKSGIDESKNLVKAETVKAESNERVTSYPGKIIAASDANLSFRIAGPIAKVNVVQGQKVKKGDILAEIDERDYKLQLSATEAEYKQIKAEAERVIELCKRRSATQNDHDKAFYGLQQITAKYNAHKNALADTKLRAPFDGYIQKIFYEASETIGAGMPVVSMISSSCPEVEINIPSSDFIKRDDFSQAYCTIDVFEDEQFPVQYIDVAKKANLNQLYTTRFLLKSTGPHTPAPGMSAVVYLKFVSHTKEMVSIPVTAMFEKEGKSCVWVIGKEKKISLRNITPYKIKKDGRILVTSGIKEGENIVIAGTKELKEGMTVKVKAMKSDTNVGNIL